MKVIIILMAIIVLFVISSFCFENWDGSAISIPEELVVALEDEARIDAEAQALTLSEAIEMALEKNPNINSMVRALRRSQYLHMAASKESLPTISTDYTFMGFPRIPEMIYSEEETFPLTDSTSFSWGSHVKMPIYTSGALRYKKTIAKLGIDVSRMQLLEAKSDLVQEVTINYFAILRSKRYLSVAAENLIRFIEHEEMTRKYYNAKTVAKNTLLMVQVKRANAHQELIVIQKDLKIARAALNVSMGIDIDSQFRLEDISSYRKLFFSPKECFNTATNHNPSLVAFSYLQEIAKKAIDLEKTGTLPKISATFSYYKHGKTPALAGDDYITNDLLIGMVVAEWKVFDWFKTRDLVKAKKKEFEMIIDNRRSVADRIALDIHRSYLSMQAAENRIRVAEKEIEHAEENYRISRLRYEEQVAKSTEVNDALVLLRRAGYDYHNAFYKYNVSLAKLERVMGTNIEQVWR
ncbi:MAG: TolC family protein [Candidatus Omnitrophica bacterium]|nr:TolC family protein [Candidatus Omnitrophota bacterium]